MPNADDARRISAQNQPTESQIKAMKESQEKYWRAKLGIPDRGAEAARRAEAREMEARRITDELVNAEDSIERAAAQGRRETRITLSDNFDKEGLTQAGNHVILDELRKQGYRLSTESRTYKTADDVHLSDDLDVTIRW